MRVEFPDPQVEGGQPPIRLTCSPSSGTLFPVGTTLVSCTVTDVLGALASCTMTVEVQQVPTISRTAFLAFGDSVTAGEITAPTSSQSTLTPSLLRLRVVPEASYPTQLLGLLRARYRKQAGELSVTNAGLSGETAHEGARRFPGVLAAVQPQVVLLLEGYNDVNVFGSNAFARESLAIEQMAREARLGGAVVFLGSLTPSRPGGRNTIQPETISAFNDLLRRVAAAQAAIFVDLYSPLSLDVQAFIGQDGLHPTELGYQVIARAFVEAIGARLEDGSAVHLGCANSPVRPCRTQTVSGGSSFAMFE